jgi:hypothetical protein
VHYAGKLWVFGDKVHAVLFHTRDLSGFVLFNPASVQDITVDWLILLIPALLFRFTVEAVYADADYIEEKRLFRVIHDIVHALPAINDNLRRAGKQKLGTLFFLEQ